MAPRGRAAQPSRDINTLVLLSNHLPIHREYLPGVRAVLQTSDNHLAIIEKFHLHLLTRYVWWCEIKLHQNTHSILTQEKGGYLTLPFLTLQSYLMGASSKKTTTNKH